MENNNPQKQAARNLFLHTDKTRAEIADLIDINTKTLYLWIKHGRWEEMKTAARQTPSGMLQDVYDHIEAINNKIRSREDRCPTFQEVEMLRKLFVSTKHIQRLNIGSYIEAFTELTAFINEHDSTLGKTVVTLTDKYIQGLIRPRPEAYQHVSDVNHNLEALKQEEEKDSIKLQEEEACAAQKAAKTENSETNTALIIPLPAPQQNQVSTPETMPHVIPTPVTKLTKYASSFFVRPPLSVPIALRSLALRTHMVGHNRASFHFITHSKSTKNDNPMPDENFHQTGHE